MGNIYPNALKVFLCAEGFFIFVLVFSKFSAVMAYYIIRKKMILSKIENETQKDKY